MKNAINEPTTTAARERRAGIPASLSMKLISRSFGSAPSSRQSVDQLVLRRRYPHHHVGQAVVADAQVQLARQRGARCVLERIAQQRVDRGRQTVQKRLREQVRTRWCAPRQRFGRS
jgi:hypothetical protein